MFNAPIGDGAVVFITIVICIIAFAAGVTHIDIIKEYSKKSDDKK